ncbi:hypothetical protein LCGC14_0714540 [marine sediment metagenome]|uniref:Peptidase S49 domain-containing protein n=1 Tax=marine sediment metagenome TaxID=412755 RepID=A0A0F9QE44_9ZZZZ
MDRNRCGHLHMGPWLVEWGWMDRAVAVFKAGGTLAVADIEEEDEGEARTQTVAGVAVIGIVGFMSKGVSSMGGTSTLAVRDAVRSATKDPAVEAIVLLIDSPGGTAAGNQELADDIAAAVAAKPVLTHFDDVGASAAFWVGAMAGIGNVSANASALVGSIGTIMSIEDTSGQFEKEGIVAHHLTSDGASMKAAGGEGTEITDEQLAYFQGIIDAFGATFVNSVANARGLDPADIRALDGRVLLAKDALAAGLIDHVRSFEDTIDAARGLARARQNDRRQQQSNRNRLRLGGV